jgi:myo-inositol-1(or 4)-monophosphatase
MNIDLKADIHDVVTEYDRAAETRVREIIEQDFPGSTVVGEENGSQGDGSPTNQATVLAHYPMPADLAADEDVSLRRYGALVQSFSAVRNTSSGALCLAHVAAGWADATFNFGTNPWDVAAGSHLLKLAGGRYHAYADGHEQPERGDFLAPDYYAHVADADFPLIDRTMQEGSRLRSARSVL